MFGIIPHYTAVRHKPFVVCRIYLSSYTSSSRRSSSWALYMYRVKCPKQNAASEGKAFGDPPPPRKLTSYLPPPPPQRHDGIGRSLKITKTTQQQEQQQQQRHFTRRGTRNASDNARSIPTKVKFNCTTYIVSMHGCCLVTNIKNMRCLRLVLCCWYCTLWYILLQCGPPKTNFKLKYG